MHTTFTYAPRHSCLKQKFHKKVLILHLTLSHGLLFSILFYFIFFKYRSWPTKLISQPSVWKTAVGDLIHSFGFKYYLCADDLPIYISIPTFPLRSRHASCLPDISTWTPLGISKLTCPAKHCWFPSVSPPPCLVPLHKRCSGHSCSVRDGAGV